MMATDPAMFYSSFPPSSCDFNVRSTLVSIARSGDRVDRVSLQENSMSFHPAYPPQHQTGEDEYTRNMRMQNLINHHPNLYHHG